MDRERLYEILDIEEPAEFDYFENIAALLECDENIGYEELYERISTVTWQFARRQRTWFRHQHPEAEVYGSNTQIVL